MSKKTLIGSMKSRIAKIAIAVAVVVGAISMAPRVANAFSCWCSLENPWGGCVAYSCSAPDLLPGARWCHSGYNPPANNEHAVYTSTNYGGYCMAFPTGTTSADLNPSGWHPGTYGGWRIASYKKGSSLPSGTGVRVCNGTYFSGACGVVTWTAPDMTGMDIRSFYSSNYP